MPTPTIVIGLGQAGCRMLTKTHEIVEGEGQQDSFKYFTIDTNKGDLDRESPDRGDITPIHLEKPLSFWEDHKSEYFYLDEDLRMEQEQGTGHSRSVSRYHIDSRENFSRLTENLENGITDFIDNQNIAPGGPGADFHIWLLNSLGGGTGSGAFPVVAAIIHDIIDHRNEQVFLNGIGSLPRLDRIHRKEIGDPPGANRLYSNAYAALSELRMLVNDKDDANWTPPEIDILSEETSLTPDTGIDAEDRMFYKYWLIGFSEEEEGTAYRSRMNRIAADAIYYYSNKDQPEDFPYAEEHLKYEPLAAITSARFNIPIEDLRQFVNLENEIAELEDDVEQLKEDIETHKTTRDYLTEVLDIELGVEGIPAELEHVDRDILTTCQNASADINPETAFSDITVQDHTVDRSELEEILVELIESAYNSRTQDIRDPEPIRGGEATEFDKVDIITLFYCDALRIYLEKILDDHTFADQINELWEGEFSENIEEYVLHQYSTLDAADPDRKWEGAIEDFIPDHGQELQEERNSTLRPVKRFKLSQKIKTLKQYNDRLQRLYEQYKRIKEFHNLTDNRFKAAREDLMDAKQIVDEDVIEEKKETKKAKLDEIDTKQTTRESTEESLREGAREQSVFEPSFQNLDRLSREDLYDSVEIGRLLDAGIVREDEVDAIDDTTLDIEEDLRDVSLPVITLQEIGLLDDEDLLSISEDMVTSIPSIASFITAEFIDQSEVARKLSDLIASPALSEDPVQDIRRSPPVAIDTEKFLGVIISEENESGPVGNILELDVEGGMNPRETITDENFNYISEMVDTTDGLSIRLISWFLPIALENSSEYGVVHRHFTDEDTDTSEQLGTIRDKEVTVSFAYPELFDDDHEVKDRIDQIEQTR
jgi:hypothetical protein